MKKATGIVRRLDELGRICLPKELRNILKVKEKGAFEIFTEGEDIILRKYQPGCEFCGSLENVRTIMETKVCEKCTKEIAKEAR